MFGTTNFSNNPAAVGGEFAAHEEGNTLRMTDAQTGTTHSIDLATVGEVSTAHKEGNTLRNDQMEQAQDWLDELERLVSSTASRFKFLNDDILDRELRGCEAPDELRRERYEVERDLDQYTDDLEAARELYAEIAGDDIVEGDGPSVSTLNGLPVDEAMMAVDDATDVEDDVVDIDDDGNPITEMDRYRFSERTDDEFDDSLDAVAIADAIHAETEDFAAEVQRLADLGVDITEALEEVSA